ncbi:MAG: PIN domain-containing protein [Sulfuritalea sp.]|nr:PIN domain-containing protein [Sulfuritalea sp.]
MTLIPPENRIVLDANVLLTGMLVPQSRSRKVLDGAVRGKYAAYVVENTIEESEKALSRVSQETGINLLKSFRDTLSVVRLVLLPRVTREEGRAYTAIRGTADKAIAAAAARISARICTNDLSDFREAGKYGLRITTPEILARDDSLSPNSFFPGFLASPSQGAIYASIGELAWAHVKFAENAQDEFYVFDWEGVCACYFEARSSSLVARLENGPALSVTCNELVGTGPSIRFVVSYDCTSEASLYFGPVTKASVLGDWFPIVRPDARIWIGCDRHGKKQLNGSIFRTYAVPYRVSDRAARNMINDITVHNPWERLSLKDMISFCVQGAT